MKSLSPEQAAQYLADVGMEIGEWNRVAIAPRKNAKSKPNWMNFAAPGEASELLCFSYWVASWLPKGKWKLFQIDDSTSLSPAEASICNRIAALHPDAPSLANGSSYIFEFGADEQANFQQELVIANLIFAFLLFEAHAYLVSSESDQGQCLGMQDGFVYFSAYGEKVSGASQVLESFKLNPLTYPDWVSQFD